MKDHSGRDRATLEASAIVDRLLDDFRLERRFGRVEIVLQDGVPSYVREERIHKIAPPPGRAGARAAA